MSDVTLDGNPQAATLTGSEVIAMIQSGADASGALNLFLPYIVTYLSGTLNVSVSGNAATATNATTATNLSGTITESQVTNLVSDLMGKQPASAGNSLLITADTQISTSTAFTNYIFNTATMNGASNWKVALAANSLVNNLSNTGMTLIYGNRENSTASLDITYPSFGAAIVTINPGELWELTVTNPNGSAVVVPKRLSNSWIAAGATPQSMLANTSYFSNSASLMVYGLPAAANLGDVFEVGGFGSGGWKITQDAGQQVHFGTSNTTTGASGYLASSNSTDCVKLVCVAQNTDFLVVSSVGNVTVF